MNCTDKDFRTAVEIALAENGFTFHVDADNMYSITNIDTSDRKMIAKLICSIPINEKLHGTKNNTEIKAIGYFKFKFPSKGQFPNFYIFAFNSNVDSTVQFIIIPSNELIIRFKKRDFLADNEQPIEFKLWLLPDDMVFDVTRFGAEGEYWFISGRMADNTIMDYTQYLNNWFLIN